MTDDGKINNIDKLINLFSSTTEISENQIEGVLGTETLGVIATVKSLGIILQKNDGKFVTGPTYYEIKRHGTFKKYHEYEISKLELSKNLLDSSIKTNKRTIWILLGTLMLSGIGLWISIFNYTLTKKQKEPTLIMRDSITNKLLNKQIEALQDLKETLKYDSLKIKLTVDKQTNKK